MVGKGLTLAQLEEIMEGTPVGISKDKSACGFDRVAVAVLQAIVWATRRYARSVEASHRAAKWRLGRRDFVGFFGECDSWIVDRADMAPLKPLSRVQNDCLVAQWPHVDAGERDGCRYARGTSVSL